MSKQFSKKYSNDAIAQALAYYLVLDSFPEAAQYTSIPASTIRGWFGRDEVSKALGAQVEALALDLEASKTDAAPVADPDVEIIEANVLLARKNQNLQDSNRIERKAFRENARIFNAAEALNNSLIEALKERGQSINTVHHVPAELHGGAAPIGVIQLSDLHINAVIADVQENRFDLEIAAKRLYKHVARSIDQFKTVGVQKVVLAFTGDQIKNIQHLSEITTNSVSRANATFIMVDLSVQMVQHLNDEGFNVVIASIVGNESRMTEHIHETDFLASDSFDLMIHKMLQYYLTGKPGVEVLPMVNTMEMVLNLNGSNLLMIHGHGHGRSAGTATLEKAFDTLAARYSSMGTRIDYMICGHIHQAYISDKFARSSSILGTDTYAARKLNLWGRASQNAYIFYTDGTIDGFKNDLQFTDGWQGYFIDPVAAQLSIPQQVKSGTPGHNMIMSANGVQFAAYTV